MLKNHTENPVNTLPLFSTYFNVEANVKNSIFRKTNTTSSTIIKNNKDKFDYEILIISLVAIIAFAIFVIVLVHLVRKRMRIRRLQKEFLPYYGYDESEAEIFDGYTQYAEGNDNVSIERLSQENVRYKALTPEHSDRSEISIEVGTMSNVFSKTNESMSSKVSTI